MNLTEFTTAVAELVNGRQNYGAITLADGDLPVTIQWGVSTEPDTIVVQTHEGDIFEVKCSRLLIEDDHL